MSSKHLVAAATGAMLLASPISQAEENLWVYAKGTDTRPQGSVEVKLSSISRIGKGKDDDYAFHDIRPEIEYGITDKLTVGAEIMIFDHNYKMKDRGDDTLEPMFDTQGGAGERFNKTQYGGFELSMKYNFLSPYKDFMGFSVGLGYENRDQYRLDGADIDQDSFTTTLFFQKNFLDDTLVFVVNPKVEFERRKSPDVLEEEISLELSAGVSYRFKPKWFVGLEFRHQSDYLSVDENGEFEEGVKPSSFDLTDFSLGDQYQRGNYIGPTIHYAEKTWWATAGVLFQYNGGGGVGYSNKNYDEHEDYHVGLTFGYEFQ
ncbi:hypothetical protein A9Q78_08510 [Methylophaga sp. 41_12_T18]|nr:hypothetical protein A9Q78_08510 [Methylophaga sp. 41_12_T18]